MFADDWTFCRDALERHSRTFAIPISLLPPPLEKTVTCAYLLCRIADTVEDTPEWDGAPKQGLYRALQDALQDETRCDEFCASVEGLSGGDPAERSLLLGLPRVLRVFAELPQALQEICRERVDELIGGMMIYSRRRAGADGVRCIESMPDLERYCYFVAGVIGRLLTEAFVFTLQDVPERQLRVLRATAEQFGAGLQMVNILRDLRADLQRGVCFVPRSLFDRAGIAPAQLCNPDHAHGVHGMLGELFVRARTHLDAAFEYTLAIPNAAPAIRNFCLVPLWLAVATLELCRSEPGLLTLETPVKLSRERVMELIKECVSASSDDRRLRESFELLDGFAPLGAA
jgi:farnesyl-diphosphate farnesyltransferase